VAYSFLFIVLFGITWLIRSKGKSWFHTHIFPTYNLLETLSSLCSMFLSVTGCFFLFDSWPPGIALDYILRTLLCLGSHGVPELNACWWSQSLHLHSNLSILSPKFTCHPLCHLYIYWHLKFIMPKIYLPLHARLLAVPFLSSCTGSTLNWSWISLSLFFLFHIKAISQFCQLCLQYRSGFYHFSWFPHSTLV
jgi:hypothetical protein